MKRTPLCMLPPPLNVVSAAAWPWDRFYSWTQGPDDVDDETASICGTVSDRAIGTVTAPHFLSHRLSAPP